MEEKLKAGLEAKNEGSIGSDRSGHSKPKENSGKEMTDEQVKEWIKQDLHAARHLLTVIVSDPLLLNQVSDAILESARSAQPPINRVPNSK